jgi:DNA-binding MarR family transcriptional regulator
MIEVQTQPIPEPHWLDETEDRAWRGLLRMIWLIEMGIGRDLMDEGLSSADYHVLANLSEAPGRQMRITDLAARIGWSKSRLSHQLSRMQARGLVCRSTVTGDGRGALAVLTPAGWEAIRKAAPGHVESIRRHLLGRLSPEQVEALAGITDAVLAGCAEKGEACEVADVEAACAVADGEGLCEDEGLGEDEAEPGAEA